jgi:hypothetical protein
MHMALLVQAPATEAAFFSNHIHAAAMEYCHAYNGASAYYYDAASSSAAAFPPAEFAAGPSGGPAPLDVVFVDYVPNEGIHPAPASSVPAGKLGTPPPPLRSMPDAAGYRGHAAR